MYKLYLIYAQKSLYEDQRNYVSIYKFKIIILTNLFYNYQFYV